MRIIDADALKEAFRGEEGAKALDHLPLRLIKVKQIVDNAPTIDAIPVEWILNKVGDEETYTLKYRHAWGELVGLWEKEQEAR